jgi:hypothetical protein
MGGPHEGVRGRELHADPAAAAGQPPDRHHRFITHRFGLGDFAEAYDVFARAGNTGALKVVLSN